MKNSFFFLIFICMMLVASTACERAEIQKSEPQEPVRITTRGECELCDDDELCCCYVIIIGATTAANLRLCGTANGMGTCSENPPDPCDDITNGGQNASLTSLDPKHEFCVTKETAFSITNLSENGVTISLVCWDQLSSPDQQNVSLDPSETEYFFVDGECNAGPCQ